MKHITYISEISNQYNYLKNILSNLSYVFFKEGQGILKEDDIQIEYT